MSFIFSVKRSTWRYVTAGVIITFFLNTLLDHPFRLQRRRGHRGNGLQYDFGRDTAHLCQHDRVMAVKREFKHVWTSYQDHAWMADQLRPLDGKQFEQFCGWSATLVDTLDTLWIMGFEDEFNEAVNATTTIDFGHSHLSCSVSLFESTIRYLGGILAAYDLSQDRRLLPKITELGETLHSAFNTETGLPCYWCNLGQRDADTVFATTHSASLADIGSLTLEFTRLSQITGKQKYQDSVMHLIDVLDKTQNESSIPGLWPEQILQISYSNEEDPLADFAKYSHAYSLGALSDSAYEYLVKGHLMLGGRKDQFQKLWSEAAEPLKDYILFPALLPNAQGKDILLPGTAHGHGDLEPTLEARVQHLACFAGGMFAMSGRMFNNPEEERIGKAITNGCVWAYENAPLGIMPEIFSTEICKDRSSMSCKWSSKSWDDAVHRCAESSLCTRIDDYPPGFLQVQDARYLLRPEAIESVFIMWRMTGDPEWRDIGWRMFEKIIEHSRSPFGHASIHTVMKLGEQTRWQNGRNVKIQAAYQDNEMESFWMAETLKYFYLLFSDPNLINLDDYVLNTEAHPLRLVDGIRGF